MRLEPWDYSWAYVKIGDLPQYLYELDQHNRAVVSVAPCWFWFRRHAFVVWRRMWVYQP